MHINFRQTNDEYTEAELLHFQQCHQCQEDLKTLEQLRASVNTIALIIPEEFNWQAIQQRTTKKARKKAQAKSKRTRLFLFKQLTAIAASTFFIAVGWLVWNNYHFSTNRPWICTDSS